MQWFEAEFSVSPEASDAVTEQLIQLGAWGIATQDPFELKRLVEDSSTTMFLDPEFVRDLPDFVRIRAYFPEEEASIRLVPCLAEEENPFFALEQRLYGPQKPRTCSREEWEKLLQGVLDQVGAFLPLGPGTFQVRPIQEEDWANGWKAHYQPIDIDSHIQICPSWIDCKPKPGQIQLQLDPGSAFGTGSHETTALCLRLLSQYLLEGDGPVLDLGCGSGILGIAAVRLGATEVEALDVDPGAVQVTLENASINGVSDQLEARVGSLEVRKHKQVPLVLANLLAEVLEQLESQLREVVQPEGYLICSGIVSDKYPHLLSKFQESDWNLVEMREEHDWVACVFQRVTAGLVSEH